MVYVPLVCGRTAVGNAVTIRLDPDTGRLLDRVCRADIEVFLRDQEVVPTPAESSPFRLRDAADRWVLAAAVAGRAEVLVTGDRDLLDVAADMPLPLLDPRAFWELARKGGSPEA